MALISQFTGLSPTCSVSFSFAEGDHVVTRILMDLTGINVNLYPVSQHPDYAFT